MVEKDWKQSSLAVDINQVLRDKEARLPNFMAASPQLKVRRFLVDWLAIICEKIDSSHGVLHLAVCYMDFFMDKFIIQESQLHLLALSCMLLAAKFEENEDKIPTIATLNKFVNDIFKQAEYHQMELLLLNFFKWNIDLPTPVHFMEYYLARALMDLDGENGIVLVDTSRITTYMRKYVHYFLEISLQDHIFLSFAPSLITSSAIAASRICLKLSPSWTTHLEKVTNYSWEKIAPCTEIMLKAHEADKKAQQKNKNAKG
ncbi:cyclin-J-like [Actinia tenebrosa]|uniref:Cyclin-J-like protein n=1 Tax=Actinia tenebrosa TaxID=6105 RepID=A0A6P8HNP1_ACTTE|nr:cyclin-J-like [Actinia tenebrosa]